MKHGTMMMVAKLGRFGSQSLSDHHQVREYRMVRSDGGEQEGQGEQRKIVFSVSLIPFFNLPSNFLFSFLIKSVSC